MQILPYCSNEIKKYISKNQLFVQRYENVSITLYKHEKNVISNY